MGDSRNPILVRFSSFNFINLMEKPNKEVVITKWQDGELKLIAIHNTEKRCVQIYKCELLDIDEVGEILK